MVSIHKKQLLIDGKPVLIRAGEIHYFRLEREEWQDRIDKLKAAGLNAVASYIPWLCHEEREGEFDLDGHGRASLDVGAFIDLCRENGLWFIARPGPFIMAEMKNEGIPCWVARKYPELVPVGWDGRPATTATLDYLHPDFLRCARSWYAAVCPILRDRLQPGGGNVIAMQLDNEIGMLSWVSNCPELTDRTLRDFREWLTERYAPDTLRTRYPFWDGDFAKGVRSPGDAWALSLKHDLGYYMRRRYAAYMETLRGYAEEEGVRDVPFLINIHGTGGGRGHTFPVGISQLYEGYTQSDAYFAGSDIYLGEMDMNGFQDLYVINAYMEAVNREDQPLASFEFECGDANYAEVLAARKDVSAVDFKTRMCVAQGNRAFNCYLFSGGRNYLLQDEPDGNGRIAITGERHGFAAPVSPEGKLNYTYDRLREVMTLLAANEEKLAVMEEERDDLALAFLPDYYMTEYCCPGSERERAMQEELTQFRGFDGVERFARSLLMDHFRFTAVNVQDRELPAVGTLAAFTCSYLAEKVQKKLLDYVEAGGNLILYGLLPVRDMEGEPCTVLKNALAIKNVSCYHSKYGYYLSVQPVGPLAGSAEVTAGHAETYDISDCVPLMVTADKRETCAFLKRVGKGQIMMIGTPYICHLENYRKLLALLGCEPALAEDSEYGGVFMTSQRNENGERFLHLMNLDGFGKHIGVYERGKPLFEGTKLRLAAKRALMLPLNMTIDGRTVEYATCEIMGRAPDRWTVRLTQEADVLVLRGNGLVAPSPDYRVEEEPGRTRVTSLLDGRVYTRLDIHFNNQAEGKNKE